MKKQEIHYENKWCKIVSIDTYYVLQSKSDKYNDQYFQTLSDAKRSIGIDILTQYTFSK